MNFEMIDLLDKTINPDAESDLAMLRTEGLLTPDGQIEKNKLNLMTGAYADDLLNAIEEADMNPEELIEHIETLCRNNQYMGVFYFLLYLFAAVEMKPPYLFMILPRRDDALRFYIGELIALANQKGGVGKTTTAVNLGIGLAMQTNYVLMGDYLVPDVYLGVDPEENALPLGKYGRMRKAFLKEHRNGTYNTMVLKNALKKHLLEVDHAAKEQIAVLMDGLLEKYPGQIRR